MLQTYSVTLDRYCSCTATGCACGYTQTGTNRTITLTIQTNMPNLYGVEVLVDGLRYRVSSVRDESVLEPFVPPVVRRPRIRHAPPKFKSESRSCYIAGSTTGPWRPARRASRHAFGHSPRKGCLRKNSN